MQFTPLRRALTHTISLLVIALIAILIGTSCGQIRTHAGIEHEYGYDFDHGHRHHHKKHKKHKHHGHHHHDDDDAVLPDEFAEEGCVAL